jgi:hypothetical protein
LAKYRGGRFLRNALFSSRDQKCKVRSIEAIQANILSGAIADTLQLAEAGHASGLPLKAPASRDRS